ncbi:MAG: MucR family transcriptional regulator [Hyphomonas sp.]|uniref:MucR family transcriptional regulator n=1 Tax=Hyphomonas sp. TaxID=87 RepID=UPI003527F32D
MAEDNLGSSHDNDLIELAAEIVSAYVGNNSVSSGELPGLIRLVHGSLASLSGEISEAEKPKPAVPIKKSVSENYLVCLEDGKKFKSLKRHLRTRYDMTPEEYREKWGLPADYPKVAPGYSRQRSQLAKKMGLGRVEK